MKTKYFNFKNLISIHHVGCFAVEFFEENKNKIVSYQALSSNRIRALRKSPAFRAIFDLFTCAVCL